MTTMTLIDTTGDVVEVPFIKGRGGEYVTEHNIYRVISTSSVNTSPASPQISIFWQGTSADLPDLARRYPRSEVLGADPLFPLDLDDMIVQRYTFRLVPAGTPAHEFADPNSGEVIDDPRPRRQTMTAYERAVHAEDVRDFPGDYGLADDEDPYDDPCYSCRGCPSCASCRNCLDWGCEECDPHFNEEPCLDCGKTIVRGDGLCKECMDEYERIKCIACSNEATHENGFCGDCGPYYTSLCSQCGEPGDDHIHCNWCHTRLPRTVSQTLCSTCQWIAKNAEIEE